MFFMKISVDEAQKLLKLGKVVALPTETVYGLAASMDYPEAVSEVFSLKNRPSDNPLIIHLEKSFDLFQYIQEKPPCLEALMSAFWPGSLTLAMEVDRLKVPENVRANLKTAAFRVSSHPVVKEVAKKVGPIVMPSANLSGRPSSTKPEHIFYDFGEDFPVVDGGLCEKGLESTVLCFTNQVWKIGREGALPKERLKQILGYEPEALRSSKAPLSPGMKYKHYSPEATLKILSDSAQGKVVIGFSDRIYQNSKAVYSLGISSNSEEIAKNLYKTLRQIDEDGHNLVFIDCQMPKGDLYEVILERLEKASSI